MVLRTDLTTGTDRALHPGQHNEVNQEVLDLLASIGSPGGIATLDGTGHVPAGELPAAAVLDSDLVDIGNLSPADDDFIQRKGSAWTNRSPAQVQADLGIVPGGGGGGGSFLSVFKWGVD